MRARHDLEYSSASPGGTSKLLRLSTRTTAVGAKAITLSSRKIRFVDLPPTASFPDCDGHALAQHPRTATGLRQHSPRHLTQAIVLSRDKDTNRWASDRVHVYGSFTRLIARPSNGPIVSIGWKLASK